MGKQGGIRLNFLGIWLKEHSLVMLLLLGTLFNVFWLSSMRNRLRMKWYAVVVVSVLHTAIGVCSVKAFAFLESGDIGNMSLFGGVFFMPVAYWIGAKFTKRSFREVCDVFTPCMLFTLMCARVNCMIAGCCTGLIISGTHFRFPTREIEIFYYIVMIILLIPRVKKNKNPGSIYPLYMASYGVLRFFDELFRTSPAERLFHIAHLWAAIAFLVGFSIYIELSNKNKKGRQAMKK